MTRLVAVLSLVGASVLLPSRARAQDDTTLAMARERFKEGVAYFDKKDFAKARVSFLQAYALKKHPAVLLNLAQSELRSGHEADAAKHFAQYLREHKEATDSERQGAETGLTAAKALVGELDLEVDSAGAEVYIDGDLEGQTPLPGAIFLPPGSHEIVAKKEGKSATEKVTASAGQSGSLSLKLSSGPKPPAAGGGTSAEHADGEVPEDGAEPEPPSHRKPFGKWLASTPSAMITTGLAGVGIIGGAAFALGSKASYDAADNVAGDIQDNAVNIDKKNNGPKGVCVDIDKWLLNNADPRYDNAAARQKRVAEYQANCDKYQDNVKSGDTFKKLAIVSFAVGGAAAVGTIIYYIADSKEPGEANATSRHRLVFMPVYEPGSYAGGLLMGRF
jgi:hypothetical protein